ncbi:endolysin [Microbacterium phage Arete]|uniref:Lysin A n=1 Tax=Microbacterium phage Arete TaxID=2713257 RepID=A0A6G8R151_9CAUD|nr:endolysin [Microbacterium phage Arete]QIN93917.1 lysin A [Microbacterium phage Arete]
MAALKNHPGMWLRDDAAAAINALEDKYGVIRINSAGRTVAEQNDLIRRYDRGEPGIFKPARPAERSNHVANGGIAVDVYNYTSDRAKLNEFGFQWYGPSDPVHYTFVGWAGNNPKGNQLTKDRQNFLRSRGWNIAADGIEGPITKQVYREYQTYLQKRGWYKGKIDGVWGNGTQAAHQTYWNELNPPKPTGALTYADIQRGLNKFGYGLVVDGIWGRKSSNALADFQRKHGLTVDRIVGPKTRAALGI